MLCTHMRFVTDHVFSALFVEMVLDFNITLSSSTVVMFVATCDVAIDTDLFLPGFGYLPRTPQPSSRKVSASSTRPRTTFTLWVSRFQLSSHLLTIRKDCGAGEWIGADPLAYVPIRQC